MKPVETIDVGSQEAFEKGCELLVCKGYKLHSSNIATSGPEYDYGVSYIAIFVLPEATLTPTKG